MIKVLDVILALRDRQYISELPIKSHGQNGQYVG